nr:hypothetical protein [Bacillus cereus]QHV08243.1 hypothetical protein C1N82_34180 [Bacillus cereus]
MLYTKNDPFQSITFCQLEGIVDILTGDEKDYSTKINKGLINYLKEVPSLLKQASPKFKRDILQLLNYLPR